MDPDYIQALVARFLSGPETLPAILSDERAQGPEGVSSTFDARDRERLAQFRSFIVRVKHNNVQKALPLTLRMLAAAGLKLQFFGAYAPTYLATRSAGPLPLARQVQMLTEHLREFLCEQQDERRAAVADVLAHEVTLWSFRSEPVALRRARAMGDLSWRGRVNVQRYASDVLLACDALVARRFDANTHVRARDCSLLYWRPADGDAVEVFEVDELTALLVSVAQQRRTVRGVATQLAAMNAGAFSAGDLEPFFEGLVERGFISPFARRAPRRRRVPRMAPCV